LNVRAASVAISSKLCKQAKGDQFLVKIWRRSGDMGGTRYLSVDNTKKKPAGIH
jgi:hypothetical protein